VVFFKLTEAATEGARLEFVLELFSLEVFFRPSELEIFLSFFLGPRQTILRIMSVIGERES
jgi:hypothetical protein